MSATVTTSEELGHSDFDRIKHLVAPLREICSATFEGNIVPRISHMETFEPSTDAASASIPIFILYASVTAGPSIDALTEATSALPLGTPTEIVQAYSKLKLCDISVFAFLPRLQEVLASLGAKAEWIAARPKPKFILHWSWNPDPYELSNHSVFLITTQEGEEYMADFTMEQFGYYDNWIMTKDPYLLNRTGNGEYRVTCQDDHNAIAALCQFIDCIRRTAERLCDAYDQFDWSVLDGIREDRLAARIRLGVVEVFSRIDVVMTTPTA